MHKQLLFCLWRYFECCFRVSKPIGHRRVAISDIKEQALDFQPEAKIQCLLKSLKSLFDTNLLVARYSLPKHMYNLLVIRMY